MNVNDTADTIGTDVVLREIPADVALSTPAEARQRAEEIRGHLTLGFGKLTLAREKRDDIALGYDSWVAYLEDQFGDLRSLGLPAGEREHVVESMRVDAQLSQRVIAERLGTSVATVNGDLRRRGVAVTEIRGADGKTYAATRERKVSTPTASYEGLSRMEETLARVTAAGARGLTSIELDAATGWPMGTASGNLSKLDKRRGLIRPSGIFRNNRSAYVVTA